MLLGPEVLGPLVMAERPLRMLEFEKHLLGRDSVVEEAKSGFVTAVAGYCYWERRVSRSEVNHLMPGMPKRGRHCSTDG